MSFNYFLLHETLFSFQFAFFTFMVRNEFFDIDKNVWWNFLELEEKVYINEWHSFCASLDLEVNNLTIAQNGVLIGRQHFEITHDDPASLKNLLPYPYIGSFSGSIADIQIFARPLTDKEMKMWTLCEKEVNITSILSNIKLKYVIYLIITVNDKHTQGTHLNVNKIIFLLVILKK